MARLEGLDEDGLQRRRLIGAEDAVVIEARVEDAALGVEDELFCQPVAERLQHAAFGLPAGGERIHDLPGIQREQQPVAGDLARFDVHGHFGELRGERRRADRADERGLPHDLMLVLLVQRVHRNLAEGERVGERGFGIGVTQHHRVIVAQYDLFWLDAEHLRRHGFDLRGDLLRGARHRAAADVGGAGGIRALVERREVRIRGVDDERVERAAQHLGGDLPQHGIRAGAQVRRAHVDVEAAVIVHLDAGGGHIQVGDARSLHEEDDADAASQMRLAGHGMPVGIAELVVPADGGGALRGGFAERVGGDHLALRLAALAPGFAHDVFGIRLDDVLQPELQRIHAECLGNLGDERLGGDDALGYAVAAIRAGARRGGVDRVAVEAHGGRVVDGQRLVPGVAEHRQRVPAVGARVAQRVHILRRHRPILLHAQAIPHDHRVARDGVDELLLAGELEEHRPPRGDGEMRSNVLVDLLLVAESGADARFDHADASLGQPQHRGEDAANVERHLGRSHDDQPVIGIPVGEADPGFQRNVLHLLRLDFGLEDIIGGGAGGVYVFHINADARGDVVLRFAVGEVHVIVLVVDDGRAFRRGGAQIEHGFEHLVFHFDEFQRVLRDLRRLGGHSSDAVAHVAHLGVEARVIQRPRNGI